jgi:transposase InsO family protein
MKKSRFFYLMHIFYRFVWLRPMSSPCAEEVSNHLKDIFRIFGTPAILLTDNGSEFKASVQTTCKELNVQLRHGRVRHPQTTGKVYN